MAKVRLEVGQIWQRDASTIPAELSERMGLPVFEPERAFIKEVTNSWVRYRRDFDRSAKATHALELSKFLKLFSFVGELPPSPCAAALAMH